MHTVIKLPHKDSNGRFLIAAFYCSADGACCTTTVLYKLKPTGNTVQKFVDSSVAFLTLVSGQ